MKKFAALAIALALAVPAAAFAQTTPTVPPTAKPAVTATPNVAQAAPKAGDAKKTETGTHTGPAAAKEQPKKN